MVYIPPELVVGGFQALSSGLGFFGDKSKADAQYRAQKKAWDLKVRQQIQATNEQNREIDRRNAYDKYVHGIQKQISAQQIGFNREAAANAYLSENTRLAEIAKQYAFKGAEMDRQLMEVQGYNRAMDEGNRGASFRRDAAKSTTGSYGKSKMEMQESLRSQQAQSKVNIRNIFLDNQQADLAAWSKSAIEPYMRKHVSHINPGSGPQRTFNSGLQIAGRVLEAGTNIAGLFLD